MNRQILFEGKVTLADQLVNFRIYKNEGDEIVTHYSFEINPEVKDANRTGYHTGDIQRTTSLEQLLSQFRQFQSEIKNVGDMRFNKLF